MRVPRASAWPPVSLPVWVLSDCCSDTTQLSSHHSKRLSWRRLLTSWKLWRHLTSSVYFVVACSKLLNACVPDTVDERALNRAAPGGAGKGAAPELARGGALQNSALCINAAKALGCSLAGVSPEGIVDGEVRQRPSASSMLTSCSGPLHELCPYRGLLLELSVLLMGPGLLMGCKLPKSQAEVAVSQEEAVVSCVRQIIRLGALRVSCGLHSMPLIQCSDWPLGQCHTR